MQGIVVHLQHCTATPYARNDESRCIHYAVRTTGSALASLDARQEKTQSAARTRRTLDGRHPRTQTYSRSTRFFSRHARHQDQSTYRPNARVSRLRRINCSVFYINRSSCHSNAFDALSQAFYLIPSNASNETRHDIPLTERVSPFSNQRNAMHSFIFFFNGATTPSKATLRHLFFIHAIPLPARPPNDFCTKTQMHAGVPVSETFLATLSEPHPRILCNSYGAPLHKQ